MRLLVISCGATKSIESGLLPATDRYTGPVFTSLRAVLREHPGIKTNLTVWILSAEFGLITANHPIPYYDHRMTTHRAVELQPQVHQFIQEQASAGTRFTATFVNLGKIYQSALDVHQCKAVFGTITYAEHDNQGLIGQRRRAMKRWLLEGEV